MRSFTSLALGTALGAATLSLTGTTITLRTPLATISAMADEPSALFSQGLRDRTKLEDWVSTLKGDKRAGAEYWAGQRSLNNPGKCVGTPDFAKGCNEAKARLTGPDALRKSEPDYKAGWNSYGAAATPASVQPSPPPVLGTTASAAKNAPRTIGYGSRAGMEVKVVSAEGLNTSHVVIRTKHTRENAIAFCRDYIGKVTEECIREELAVPLVNVITANCSTGEFTDFGGNRYRFLGPNREAGDSMAEYAIKDLATGEIADGSSASGYPTNMEIFRALCPASVASTPAPAATAPVASTPAPAAGAIGRTMGAGGIYTEQATKPTERATPAPAATAGLAMCSLPEAKESLGVCTDLAKLPAPVSQNDKDFRYIVRLVQSNPEVQAAFQCMDEAISGQKNVYGFRDFAHVIQNWPWTAFITVGECHVPTTIANRFPNGGRPEMISAITFACTDAQRLWELYYSRLQPQMTLYWINKCGEATLECLHTGNTREIVCPGRR